MVERGGVDRRGCLRCDAEAKNGEAEATQAQEILEHVGLRADMNILDLAAARASADAPQFMPVRSLPALSAFEVGAEAAQQFKWAGDVGAARGIGGTDLERDSPLPERRRSEEHTTELQTLMRTSYT